MTMTRGQEMVQKLREASVRNRDGQLLADAAETLQSMIDLSTSCLTLMRQEGNWRIPLADGVRAEVTIYGKHTIEHVRTFAAMFSFIAEHSVVKPEQGQSAHDPDPQTSESAEASANT